MIRMKNALGLSLLLLGLLCALSAEVKITKCIMFGPHFKEPYEYLIFVFRDDTAFKFTSQDEQYVQINATQFEAICQAWHRCLEDLVLVIHNHPTPGGWSACAREFILDLRARGFKGPALLYMPGGILKPADF